MLTKLLNGAWVFLFIAVLSATIMQFSSEIAGKMYPSPDRSHLNLDKVERQVASLRYASEVRTKENNIETIAIFVLIISLLVISVKIFQNFRKNWGGALRDSVTNKTKAVESIFGSKMAEKKLSKYKFLYESEVISKAEYDQKIAEIKDQLIT